MSGFCVKEETIYGDGRNLLQDIRKSRNYVRGCSIGSEERIRKEAGRAVNEDVEIDVYNRKVGQNKERANQRHSENGRIVKYNAINRAEVVRTCKWKSRKACATA